jgi:hypothetical protein
MAIFGTLLGLGNLIWNLVQYQWRTRVVLRVKPCFARIQQGCVVSTPHQVIPDGFLIATIINESHFPVTLEKVSVLLSGMGTSFAPIAVRTNPQGPWPRRLDRKESTTVLIEQATPRMLVKLGARAVEVETADGTKTSGTCPALEAVLEEYWRLPKAR